MYKAVNHGLHQYSGNQVAGTGFFDDSINYKSDEFRMYGFKIKHCPKMRSHDWTLCPFAHRSEKARRRDPRKHNYAAIACPDFRNGDCKRGEDCPLAHGIFEYWLHPAKYRTRACNTTGLCQRKVCFFAHSPAELRPETKYKWHYRVKSAGGNFVSGGGGGGGAKSGSPPPLLPVLSPVPVPVKPASPFDAETEFLRSLRSQSTKEISNIAELAPKSLGCDELDFDFPNVEWISELLE